MYLVIGKNGCSACTMTQTVLKNKGIDFKYVKLEDLPEDEKKKYISMAQKEVKLSMPLIIKNEKMFTLREVM